MSRTNALSAGGARPALKLIYDNYVESLNSAPTLVYKIVGSFLV
jgi:hypothetical protein